MLGEESYVPSEVLVLVPAAWEKPGSCRWESQFIRAQIYPGW